MSRGAWLPRGTCNRRATVESPPPLLLPPPPFFPSSPLLPCDFHSCFNLCILQFFFPIFYFLFCFQYFLHPFHFFFSFPFLSLHSNSSILSLTSTSSVLLPASHHFFSSLFFPSFVLFRSYFHSLMSISKKYFTIFNSFQFLSPHFFFLSIPLSLLPISPFPLSDAL